MAKHTCKSLCASCDAETTHCTDCGVRRSGCWFCRWLYVSCKEGSTTIHYRLCLKCRTVEFHAWIHWKPVDSKLNRALWLKLMQHYIDHPEITGSK